MRKFNALLTVLIMILFLVHAVFGAYELIGANIQTDFMKITARVCSFLIVIHAIISIKLTIEAIRVWKSTGAPYLRENGIFWARRISGLAIMVLIFFHMFAFGHTVNGIYQLKQYTFLKMCFQLLFVLSIALHVITNVRPMLIALGARSLKKFVPDILLVLSIILILFIAAFIIYYFRWQAV